MKTSIRQLNKILVFQLSTMQWVETSFKKNISTVRQSKFRTIPSRYSFADLVEQTQATP